MSSIHARSKDDLILHKALDARMLSAIEFASIAAELESRDMPADEYLLANGYISEDQRKQILAVVADADRHHQDATQFEASGSSEHPASAALGSVRASVLPASQLPTPATASIANGDSRYEWLEKFAQGGLGAVWRARDTTIDRKVALKEILPKARKNAVAVERFLEEARITGQLQHPGVVPIYDIGTNGEGCPFYVMKFVEGQTLHDAIRRHFDSKASRKETETSLRQLLNVFIGICRTMQYAHDKGFIHRDLKPRNIMLGDYGETLVVDWGLAKTIVDQEGETLDVRTSGSSSSGSSSHTASSRRSEQEPRRVVGTPSYLAPEQARGEVHAMDARSDIYSLGVVLFQILTGKTPFSGSDSETIIDAVTRGEFPAPRQISRQIPTPLNSICLKAMGFRKQDRYQSAHALADEIERFLAGDRVLAHAETGAERAQRILAKNQKTTFAALCGLAALSAVIAIAAFQINTARAAEMEARVAADVAREAESIALQRETVAKNEAVMNLRSALDAVDTWLLRLSGDLEFYPGLSRKRTEFLESAANYYANLSRSQGSDISLNNEAARAAIRAGDARQLLGQMKEAAPMFGEAIDWFRAQVVASPGSVDYRKELANALIGQAIVATREGTSLDLATRSIDEAAEILRSLVTQYSDDIAIRTALARVGVASGRLQIAKGEPSSATTQFEDARRRLVDIVKHPDAAARHVALYHSTLFELIDLYVEAEDFQAAREIAREAIRAFDKAIAAMPTRPDYYEGRMTARILMGNVWESIDREDEALQEYAAASEDYRQLMKSLFRGEYRSENLVTAEVNRARILLSRGEAEEAHSILLNARDELSQLIQLHGQQPRLLRIFSGVASTLAESHVARSDQAAATKQYQDATVVLEHLHKNGTASSDDVNRLAIAYRELSKLAAAGGDTSTAIGLCRQAIDVLELENVDAIRDLSEACTITLATCHQLHSQLVTRSKAR